MPETIGQLEERGFTHIECWCEPCRRSVWMPFKTVRERLARPVDELTIGDLAKLMPCGNCGQRGTRYREIRQEDMPGYGRL